MFIFHKHKVIYIIVPGTGSNSFHGGYREKYSPGAHWEQLKITKKTKADPIYAVNPDIGMYQHWTAEQVKMFIDSNKWNSYRKIGFVRDPYEWTCSLYKKGAGVKHAVGIDNDGTYMEYIEKLEKTPYFWFTNSSGDVIIDTIYRTEDLQKICLEFDIPYLHKNKTSLKSKRKCPEKNEEIEKILREKFYREYEHYE